MKIITYLSFALLCLVFTQCENEKKTNTEVTVDTSDLPHAIVSARAMSLDSLQRAMNEIESMITVAENQKVLDSLEIEMNENQQKCRTTLLLLKKSVDANGRNSEQISKLLSVVNGPEKDAPAKKVLPTKNKLDALVAECIARYDFLNELLEKTPSEERGKQLHSRWLLEEMTRELKGSYSTPEMDEMVKLTRFQMKNVVKGKIAKEQAVFSLDLSKKHIVCLCSADNDFHYTYSDEAGVTLIPQDGPTPERVKIYFDRLLEDMEVLGMKNYGTIIGRQNRQKEAISKRSKWLKEKSIKLDEFVELISLVESPIEKIQAEREKINSMKAEESNMEETRDRLRREIEDLKGQLK